MSESTDRIRLMLESAKAEITKANPRSKEFTVFLTPDFASSVDDSGKTVSQVCEEFGVKLVILPGVANG